MEDIGFRTLIGWAILLLGWILVACSLNIAAIFCFVTSFVIFMFNILESKD